MRRRKLPGTNLEMSVFSFGTASLHHLNTEPERQSLLARAADAGFTHFDTAPLYGFGLAERSLAPLLKARKSLTVATKVGLYPPGGASQSSFSMLARKAGGKVLPGLSRAVADWTVRRARDSFEGSLRRLGRERVDILLLHEPRADLIKTDEWLGWLSKARDSYRHVGVAGQADRIGPFLKPGAPFGDVVQIADSLTNHEADVVLTSGRPLQLSYGYVSADRESPAEKTLALARDRNATGSILVSTRQESRLAVYARLGA